MVHRRGLLALLALALTLSVVALLMGSAGPPEPGAAVMAASGAMTGLDNPRLCTTCHLMTPQYQSYASSSHADLASCNDCHVDHGLIAGPVSKVRAGARHVAAFLTGDVPHPIPATDETQALIQKNCLRCHGQIVKDTSMGEGPNCSFCHRDIPHEKPYAIGR